MNHFFDEIKLCFKKYSSSDIILEHKEHNKKIKVNPCYIILYRFYTSMFSNEESTELINKSVQYSRSSLYRQEKQISLDYYKEFSKSVY